MKKRFVVLCSAGLLLAGCVPGPTVDRDACVSLMRQARTHSDSIVVLTARPGDGRYGETCLALLSRPEVPR